MMFSFRRRSPGVQGNEIGKNLLQNEGFLGNQRLGVDEY